MADKLLLSELCRICNSNKPKYCCPRCACQTCSLPCYKRHKTWSQCSGKRDPAAYMKRSQLATAAGIDHDFNFLTGIERAFGDADRDVKDRGIRMAPNQQDHSPALRKLSSRFRDAGVQVRRAPKGMSRQRENHTHCTGRDGTEHISWTVEWILPGGSRKLKNCSEHETIEDAYLDMLRGNSTYRSRKRKRAARAGAGQSNEQEQGRKYENDIPHSNIAMALGETNENTSRDRVDGNQGSELDSHKLDSVDAQADVAKPSTSTTMLEVINVQNYNGNQEQSEAFRQASSIEVNKSEKEISYSPRNSDCKEHSDGQQHSESNQSVDQDSTSNSNSLALSPPDELAERPLSITKTAELVSGPSNVDGSVQNCAAQQSSFSNIPMDAEEHVDTANSKFERELLDDVRNKTDLTSTDERENIGSNPAASKLHFYLHRPLSATASRVLIALSSTLTLREVLFGRNVLEFPTIYVLHETPEKLGPGRILEAEYLRYAKKMIEELDEELRPFVAEEGLHSAGQRDAQPPQAAIPDIDESQILETLKRDVAAAGR